MWERLAWRSFVTALVLVLLERAMREGHQRFINAYAALAAIIAFCLFVLTCQAATVAPIRLRVRPQMAMGPVTVRIELGLRPVESDRLLQVEAQEHGLVVRRSVLQLDGLESRTFWVVEWVTMPPGEYDIVASVGNSQGQLRASTRIPLRVVGGSS